MKNNAPPARNLAPPRLGSFIRSPLAHCFIPLPPIAQQSHSSCPAGLFRKGGSWRSWLPLQDDNSKRKSNSPTRRAWANLAADWAPKRWPLPDPCLPTRGPLFQRVHSRAGLVACLMKRRKAAQTRFTARTVPCRNGFFNLIGNALAFCLRRPRLRPIQQVVNHAKSAFRAYSKPSACS